MIRCTLILTSDLNHSDALSLTSVARKLLQPFSMTPTFLGKRWLHRISLAAVAILLSIRMGLASDTEQERINTLLARIPPVVGEFEACLDLAPPQPDLRLARHLRSIIMTRMLWRMRAFGVDEAIVTARLDVTGRETSRVQEAATRYLRTLRNDPIKLDGYCEHVAMLLKDLVSDLE